MTDFMNGMPAFKKLLSDDHYNRFQQLVLRRTGMLFGVKRRNALGRGVTALCETFAGNDLEKYYRMLEATETDSPLWDALIEELTIGETYFFRDENQIRALRSQVLPRIIESHRNDRRIRIWSAGCASGEEPYTLSILLAELLGNTGHWNISILGTDINKKVIRKAKAARYRPWSFRQTPSLMKSRYFRELGEDYEALSIIRKNVDFEYLNLNEPSYPSLFTNTNALDLVLCRNVAIYYSEDVVRDVVSRFYQCLIPGGWLMMGASETSIPVFDQYDYHLFEGGTVYQKPKEGAAAPVRFQFQVVEENPEARGSVEPVPKTGAAFLTVNDNPFPRIIEDFEIEAEEPGDLAVTDEIRPKTAQANDLLDQGKEFLRRKQYDEARKVLSMALSKDPGEPESLYHLGRVYANIGCMDKARSFCEQAIKSNPLKPEVYYTLALIHQESGDDKAAMACLKRSLFLEPDFAMAHVSMAILCRQMKQTEKSERHRRQAMDLASGMEPETVMPGSDDLTARMLLTMAKTIS
jgi:chemotaxis protein methyltransferase CheR